MLELVVSQLKLFRLIPDLPPTILTVSLPGSETILQRSASHLVMTQPRCPVLLMFMVTVQITAQFLGVPGGDLVDSIVITTYLQVKHQYHLCQFLNLTYFLTVSVCLSTYHPKWIVNWYGGASLKGGETYHNRGFIHTGNLGSVETTATGLRDDDVYIDKISESDW